MNKVVPLARRAGESAEERLDLVVVGEFRNDTDREMRLYLEMVPEELIMSPGHEIVLLARASADLLPIHVAVANDGLQIHARKEFDPDWHVRFRGKLIKPGTPTRLADHE